MTLYVLIGVAALLLAAGFLLSQYIDYQQLKLSREKAIEDCIQKEVGSATGFVASNKARECREKFSR